MLYLIQSGSFYKIGYTTNLRRRMAQYKTHNPNILLLGLKEGTLLDEQQYHQRFSEFKYQTEWFRLPKYVLEELINEFNVYQLINVHNIKETNRIRSNIELANQELQMFRSMSENDKRIELRKYSFKFREFYITIEDGTLVFNLDLMKADCEKHGAHYHELLKTCICLDLL